MFYSGKNIPPDSFYWKAYDCFQHALEGDEQSSHGGVELGPADTHPAFQQSSLLQDQHQIDNSCNFQFGPHQYPLADSAKSTSATFPTYTAQIIKQS